MQVLANLGMTKKGTFIDMSENYGMNFDWVTYSLKKCVRQAADYFYWTIVF